jgi:cellulose synthase/poly-beta-1,6-N-acetylglucosamine synthase-like glycosyltransferase
MSAAEIVFWSFAFLLFYTYLGFPLALAFFCLFKRPKPLPEMKEWPHVSVLVVAHNEQDQIRRKIENIFSCDYPPDRLEVVVCSDGSTDRTNEIVTNFGDPRVKLAATQENRGVNEAFAHGTALVAGDLLLMTDSGGLFEPQALKTALRYFADPTVGVVNGLFDHANPEGKPIAGGYRSYWAIETLVRLLETRLGYGCVIVGAFEIIRRQLYRPISSDLTNDMIVPMELYAQGFRTVYEPRAIVRAPQKKDAGQEFNRRARVAVRGWCSLPVILKHVPVWKTPMNWLVLWSHKYMRWLTGLLLIGLLVTNVLLWHHAVYAWLLVAQGVFYAAAAAGLLLSMVLPRIPKMLVLPYWFCLVQAAGIKGLWEAVRGRRISTWKPEP